MPIHRITRARRDMGRNGTAVTDIGLQALSAIGKTNAAGERIPGR
jgi:hypothetical protein